MADEKSAAIDVRKALLNVSLTTIAAIGSATGLPWLAGVTALPAALASAEAWRALLARRPNPPLELLAPPGWTRSAQDWHTVCFEVEQSLPRTLDTVAQKLQHTQTRPTNERLRQLLTRAIADALPKWEVPERDRAMIAAHIAPLLLEKALEVLKPLRDELRQQSISDDLAALTDMIGKVFDLLNAAQHAPLPPSPLPPLTSQVISNYSTAAIADVLERKLRMGAYDVYMCYNEADEAEVFPIGNALKAHGVLPWFDILAHPGGQRRKGQERAIQSVSSAAVLVGQHAIERGQELQMYAFIEQFVERECRVIPVLLSSAPHKPPLPPFLATFAWVDFRRSIPDPLYQFLWGITDERPTQ